MLRFLSWAEGWVHSLNMMGEHTLVPLFPCLSFVSYMGCFRAVYLYLVPTLGFSSAGCAVHKINVPVTVQGEAVPMGHQ